MARQNKDAKHLTFNLKSDVVDMINEYSEQTSIPKTAIVEKAIESYLKNKLNKK